MMLPATLFEAPYSTLVLDREGRLLAASIAADGQWRFPPGGAVPETARSHSGRFEFRRRLRQKPRKAKVGGL